MTNDSPNEYAFREYPIRLLVAGLLAAGGGIYFYRLSSKLTFTAGIVLAVSLIPLFLAAVLDVRANRITRTLHISRRGLLQHYRREIPFGDITDVRIATSVDSDSGSRTYRVELSLADGSTVPLRKVYSSGHARKQAQVQQLREVIGLGNANAPAAGLSGLTSVVAQAAQPRLQAEQESISGDQAEVHETDGVRWQLKTLTFGSAPISRWQSADVRLPDNFIYLAQKIRGQKQPHENRLVQAMHKKLLAQALKIYGFAELAAPYLQRAEIFTPEARLAENYFAYASDVALAAQRITPWTSIPLADWAQRHPFVQNSNEQLTWFFGPSGLYLAVLGIINADYLAELTDLGVEIVHAQGG